MAKTSNLREFQQSILTKLKDAASQVGVASSSRLGVIAGSKRFLIHLNEVKEALPVPPFQGVPLTKAWFLGVANVRGNLYSITDLAHFIGMPPTAKSMQNRILLLSTETTSQAALLVNSVVGLRSVQEMRIKQTDSDANQHFGKLVYIDEDENEWLELDIETLVQNKDFVQPNV